MPETIERLQAGHDFVAALHGDAAALDRLNAPEAEGGYGCGWLARQVPWERGRADEWTRLLSDPDRLADALDLLAEADYLDGLDGPYSASDAAMDAATLAACSDHIEVRDPQDGDDPGRYYAP